MLTNEEIERMLRVAQSGIIDQEYRDVFLRLPEILRELKAAKEREMIAITEIAVEKLVNLRNDGYTIFYFWEAWIRQSRDEIQRIKEELAKKEK